MSEDQAYQIGYVVGVLVGMAAMFAIACVLFAVFLRLAARWIEGMQVSFGRAFGTAVLVALAAGAINFGIGLLAPLGAGPVVINAMHVVSVLAGFFIAAAVVSWMLTVRYSRALLITVIVYALQIGLAIAVVVLIVGFSIVVG